MPEKTSMRQTAINIVKTLQAKGFIAYFAGGCVRDQIMKKEPEDYDIATTAKPEVVEKLFEKTIPVGKQFGVILVVCDGMQFEVATFREEGDYHDGRHPAFVHFSAPEKDAYRRDFTINGMFYDPIKNTMFDFVAGENDIQNKIIRSIGNSVERFREDKLRILRAVRFANTLNFSIEPSTRAAVQQMADQITVVSQERIRDELIKLFTRRRAGDGLHLLSDLGLLKVILPEIEAMKGVEQSPEFHPEGDVFIHTAMVMNQMKNPSTILAFGGLLHDVGKPPTFMIRNDKITFYTHEHVGVEMGRKILRRLRFSNDTIDGVLSCIDNHMKFANVKQMRIGKLKRFIDRSHFDEELELHRIDCKSSHGKLENYEFLKEKIEEYRLENLKPKPLINGHDLIEIGYQPGPVMKTILEEVYTLQLESKWKAKGEVLEWVQQNYPPKKTK